MANKIAIIGGGNLGTAIALGAVKAKLTNASDITITRRHLAKIDHLKSDGFQLTTDNAAAIKEATLVILCVQPKQLGALLAELAPSITDKHILVSTITGISTE